jgi:glucokinase-like ROK family protein
MKRLYRSGDQTLLREINLSTVLLTLQQGKAVSRAGLATLTGLNKTTISNLVEKLSEWGLVHEIGRDTSGNGRPATLIALNPQAGCIIGIELGVDFISIVLTDFSGQIIWQQLAEIDPTIAQNLIIQQALSLVDEAKEIVESGQQRLLGIGVTVPGLVKVDEGLLLFSPNLQWRNVPLRQIFFEATKLPIYLENDANAAALGEHLFGLARQTKNFVFLNIGIGIGSGLFLNGELYRGGGGIAGEIGHTNFTAGSRPCHCGNRGCWETSGNQYSLIERVWALLNVGRSSVISKQVEGKNAQITLAMIKEAAETADEMVLEALAETGAAIGLGVANITNIFNPDLIIIGGAMSVFGEHLLPSINRIIEKHVLTEMRPQTKVLISSFGTKASVMGAISLVVQAALSNPSWVTQG